MADSDRAAPAAKRNTTTLAPPTFDDLLQWIENDSEREVVIAYILDCSKDLSSNAAFNLLLLNTLTEAEKDGKIKGSTLDEIPNLIPKIIARCRENLDPPAADESAVQKSQNRHVDNLYQVLQFQRGGDNFDLIRFASRVSELFAWHKDVREDISSVQYKYPVLPIIQSSGTGKTKLLWDYRMLCLGELPEAEELKSTLSNISLPTAVFYLTCIRRPEDEDNSYFFDVGSISRLPSFGEQQERFSEMLNNLIYPENSTGNHQIVLLIDEAQELTKRNSAFLYRVLCWYLCERRHGHQIVAVTAGTNSSLADSFPEVESETNSSRVTSVNSHFEPGGAKFLFPPFADLWTMGCLSKLITFPTDDRRFNEYEKSIPYGRPYFATLIAPQTDEPPPTNTIKASEVISEAEHVNILSRMLLDKPFDGNSDPAQSLLSCISILGTRVQLGGTHSSVTSELVAKGYAHLVFFESNLPTSSLPDTARFAYLPDPVCARLAMCMMDDDWSISANLKGRRGESNPSKAKQIAVKGLSKVFWVRQLGVSLSSGLCQPPKDNKGELFAALYMLFCGDALRKAYNDDYCTFSVSLESWVEEMISQESRARRSTLKVGFIQMSRNNMRNTLKERTSQESLKLLYDMKIMTYTFEGHTGIDMIGSAIMLDEKAVDVPPPKYTGIYVSVKNEFGRKTDTLVTDANSMIKQLKSAGRSCGLILLICFGRADRSPVPAATRGEGDSYAPFLTNISEAGTTFVARIVDVRDDTYGLADTLEQIVSDGTPVAEQYASHPLLATSTSNVLRKSSKAGRFRPSQSVCTPDDSDVQQVINQFQSSREERNKHGM